MNSLLAYCADTPVQVHWTLTDKGIHIDRVLAEGGRPLSLTKDMLEAFTRLVEETYR